MGGKTRKKTMDINEFLRQKAEFEEALAKTGAKMLSPLFEPVLKLVDYVVWEQYTPHFNDGCPCVFSVHEPNFIPLGKEEDEEYMEKMEDEGFYNPLDGTINEFYWNKEKNPDYDPKLGAAAGDLIKNWGKLEEVFERSFGDGVRVWAYIEDGEVVFDVEEYSHD